MSKDHVTARAKAPCRLAVLVREHLDSDALLGVATEQISRLQAHGGAGRGSMPSSREPGSRR